MWHEGRDNDLVKQGRAQKLIVKYLNQFFWKYYIAKFIRKATGELIW